MERWCAAYDNPATYKWVMEYEGIPIGNISVIRLSEKCGLTFEGTKREYFKTSAGEFLDISDYGIIRSEWKNIRQEK